MLDEEISKRAEMAFQDAKRVFQIIRESDTALEAEDRALKEFPGLNLDIMRHTLAYVMKYNEPLPGQTKPVPKPVPDWLKNHA